MELVRRWPPILWVLGYVASLFILQGGTQGWHAHQLIIGLALMLAVFVVAVYLMTRVWKDRPHSRSAYLAWGGLALFYLLCAVAGWIAGPGYALAALAAGLVPLTGLALLLATFGQKTRETERGLQDLSAEAHDDPYPGLGFDDKTPVGDTPEYSDYRDDPEPRKSPPHPR